MVVKMFSEIHDPLCFQLVEIQSEFGQVFFPKGYGRVFEQGAEPSFASRHVRFGDFPGGDVAGDALIANGFAIQRESAVNQGFHPDDPALSVVVLHLHPVDVREIVCGFGLLPFPLGILKDREGIFGNQIHQRRGVHFFRGEPPYVFHRGGDVGEVEIVIQNPEHVGHVLGQETESVLCVAQGLCCPAAFSGVLHDRDDVDERAVRVHDRVESALDGVFLAFTGANGVLPFPAFARIDGGAYGFDVELLGLFGQGVLKGNVFDLPHGVPVHIRKSLVDHDGLEVFVAEGHRHARGVENVLQEFRVQSQQLLCFAGDVRIFAHR